MSDVLTLSQIRMPGVARSKDDAIREAGEILVDAGAVDPAYIDSMFDRAVGLHLHGQLPGHPARHQRVKERSSGRRCR